ncbi:M20 metallopeptidase family protein [Bacillus kwashiorkori]|uniref:M20 metallopeptidase family protein n=1 Tax=Bacillus kwashiorkori TaxID=1522318 RepID=UPI000785478B|nr:M20 family metallopeptidase [Bacillus kwashiorkori]
MGKAKALLTDLFVQEIIDIRRDFHRHPELSGEEYETSKKVQSYLQEAGIEFRSGFAKTGVLGIIKGAKRGGVVAVRADMDALPIQEQNNLPYKSKVSGKMHACGHDAHTAMLIGVGRLLQEMKEEIHGTVLLVFQPAEENAPIGGSKPMMEDGVFNDIAPDCIFGLHVWPDLPVGKIGVRAHEIMGASDRFKITIQGSGGHASMPHQTIDAVIVASQLINQLQTIVSRNVDPLDSAVITVGKITGGDRYNVIAEKVVLEGTIRTFKNEVKSLVKSRFYNIVEGTAKIHGANVEIDYFDGYPATMNTPKWADVVKKAADNALGNDATPEVNPSLGGEDFARFLEKYEGAFFWLGSKMEEGIQKPLHDSQFILNEDCIAVGMEVMTTTVLEALTNFAKVKEGAK